MAMAGACTGSPAHDGEASVDASTDAEGRCWDVENWYRSPRPEGLCPGEPVEVCAGDGEEVARSVDQCSLSDLLQPGDAALQPYQTDVDSWMYDVFDESDRDTESGGGASDEPESLCNLAHGCPSWERGTRLFPGFTERGGLRVDEVVESNGGTIAFATTRGVLGTRSDGQPQWVVGSSASGRSRVAGHPAGGVVVLVLRDNCRPLVGWVRDGGAVVWSRYTFGVEHPIVSDDLLDLPNGDGLLRLDVATGEQTGCYIIDRDVLRSGWLPFTAFGALRVGTATRNSYVWIPELETSWVSAPHPWPQAGDFAGHHPEPAQRSFAWDSDLFVAAAVTGLARLQADDSSIRVNGFIDTRPALDEWFGVMDRASGFGSELIVDTAGSIYGTFTSPALELRVDDPFGPNEQATIVGGPRDDKHIMQDGTMIAIHGEDVVATDVIGGGTLWSIADVVRLTVLRDGRILTLHTDGSLHWWSHVHGTLADTPSPTFGYDHDHSMNMPLGPFPDGPRQIPVAWSRE